MPEAQSASTLVPSAFTRLDRASNQVSTQNTQLQRHIVLNEERLIATEPNQARRRQKYAAQAKAHNRAILHFHDYGRKGIYRN